MATPTSQKTKTHRRKLGAHIRDLRQRAGLSQRELGEKVGLKQSSLSNIEAGRQPISNERLAALMRVIEPAAPAPPRVAKEVLPIIHGSLLYSIFPAAAPADFTCVLTTTSGGKVLSAVAVGMSPGMAGARAMESLVRSELRRKGRR